MLYQQQPPWKTQKLYIYTKEAAPWNIGDEIRVELPGSRGLFKIVHVDQTEDGKRYGVDRETPDRGCGTLKLFEPIL